MACLAVMPGACIDPPEPSQPRRQVFTLAHLPSLSDPVPDHRLTRAEVAGRVLYVRLSGALEQRGGRLVLDLAPDALREAVVLIGATDDPRDKHLTPLGLMSGAEVMLNGIRALSELDPIPDEFDWRGVSAELLNTLVSASLFGLFFWVVWTWLRRSILPAWLAPTVAIVLFAFVGVVAVSATVALAAIGAVAQGGHYDIVTPALGTSLETLIEGMNVVILRIEAGWLGAAGWVWRLTIRRRN